VRNLDKKRLEIVKDVCPGLTPAHHVFSVIDEDNPGMLRRDNNRLIKKR